MLFFNQALEGSARREVLNRAAEEAHTAAQVLAVLAAPAFVGEWGGELREAGWKHG